MKYLIFLMLGSLLIFDNNKMTTMWTEWSVELARILKINLYVLDLITLWAIGRDLMNVMVSEKFLQKEHNITSYIVLSGLVPKKEPLDN